MNNEYSDMFDAERNEERRKLWSTAAENQWERVKPRPTEPVGELKQIKAHFDSRLHWSFSYHEDEAGNVWRKWNTTTSGIRLWSESRDNFRR